MKRSNIIFSFSLLGLLLLASCGARQEYKRPADIAEENLYRTDLLPKDSLGWAGISWRELFKDPNLQQHISKALDNNLDVRVALTSISSAEAYLKQAKSAYLPTLSVGPG